MSTSVDNRAVQLGFDNKQFESGVKESVASLNELKKGLELNESAKSLTNLANAGRSFDLSKVSDNIQNVSDRFSTFGIIGMTILQNLTNKAMEFGQKLWTSMLSGARGGFEEYETQMNAIQTILANTASKGTTMEQVNEALDELNHYADMTIYNFSQMTKNIGTFTAAGIDLDTAVAAIKGIANLAAVSGSNSQQASTAMYQLSQALASGTVKLMDWNSVVNAGMGGQVFQDALKETARVHGVAVDQIIKDEGSFRESLSKGWITSQILTETLAKFTGDLNADQLRTLGYTEEQIVEIQKLGKMANDAATKVKTLTQLKETIGEAIGSGWATTFKIIVGDFEEAKSFFTYLSDTFGALIQESSDSRNNMLQGWKDLGGRTLILDSVKNVINSVITVMNTFKETWAQMFPSKDKTGASLFRITKAIKEFTDKLRPTVDGIRKLKVIFGGLFAIFDIIGMAVKTLIGSFGKLDTSGIKPLLNRFVDFLYKTSLYLLNLRSLIKNHDLFGKALVKLKIDIGNVKDKIGEFGDKVKGVFGKFKNLLEEVKNLFGEFKTKFQEAFNFKKIDTSGVSGFINKIKIRFQPLETLFNFAGKIIDGLISLLKKAAPSLLKIAGWIGNVLSQLASAVFNAIANLDFNSIFDTLNSGMMAALLLAITKFFTKGSGVLSGVGDMFSGITDLLDGVRGSLEAYQKNLQSKTLLNIAFAVGILAASLLVLSLIDSKKLTVALAAVSGLFADLVVSMAALSKATGGGMKGAIGLSVTLIGIGVALLLITAAVKSLSDLDEKQLKNGLLGLAAITTGLVVFMTKVGSNAKSFIKSAISLILLGASLEIMVNVVKKLGAMDPDALMKGLGALAVVLGELGLFTQLVGKMGVGTGVGILLLSASLLIIYSAVEKFGKMNVKVLTQGLKTIGLIMAEIALFTQLTGSGKNLIATSIGMTIIAAAMLIFVNVIDKLSKFSWEELGKGLAGMGGALLAIAIAMRLMPKNMLLNAVGLAIVGGAIYILTQALTEMSKLSWEEIGRGLATLAASLGIIVIAMMGMQGAIGGALALLVVSGALAVLTPVLKALGSMEIGEIAIALGALAAVFLLLGIAGYALTPVVPTLIGLAGSILLLGVGIAAIGGGVLLFSAGLAALAVSGVAGATALVGVVGIILGLIPMLVKALVGAIILFAQLIIEAAPVIGKALITLIAVLCEVIIQSVPVLVDALQVLLDGLWKLIKDQVPKAVDAILYVIGELLKSLADKIPEFTQSAFDILIGFLQGVRDNIGEVVTVAGEIVTEFLDALALKIPDIIQSGFDLLISFIDGITKAIEENGPDLADAIGRLATAIITGLTDGLLGGVGAIVDAIGNIGGAIIDALKTLLGIASPSTVTFGMGKYTAIGLAKGLIKYSSVVANAAKDLGTKAISGMNGAIKRISDGLNNNLDVNPIITPVLDLSDIQNGSKSIDTLFGKKSILLSQNMSNLSLAANGMLTKNGTENSINAPPNQGTTITFNQTNTSPKALSQFDIYRNTRNQLLMLKGLVVNT